MRQERERANLQEIELKIDEIKRKSFQENNNSFQFHLIMAKVTIVPYTTILVRFSAK